MRFCLCAVVALAVACGGDSGSKIDAASHIDAFASTCGHPGDTGNELGIGGFCASLNDCTMSTAPLCSSLGDPSTHFCTRTCQGSGSNAQCGTNTTCTCNSSNQCGCTPNACL